MTRPLTFAVILALFQFAAPAAAISGAHSDDSDAVVRLDLDGDAARQTVVDKESGVYLGHVSTLLLEDGKTILAAYPKGHGKGPIVLKRSEDGGKTWSPRLPVPDSWATSMETPTLFRVDKTERGESLILFSGLYPIRAARSADGGRTWTELAPIGDFGGIVAMGGLADLGDGKFAAFFHDDGRFFAPKGKATGTFTLYQTDTADAGSTWPAPRAIWSGSDVHLCEPGVVASPDDHTFALLLRENRRVKNAHVMFSTDKAATWSAPVELPAHLTGDRHIAAYAKDGRLVVTFRCMAKDDPWKGDWVAWVGTWEEIARLAPEAPALMPGETAAKRPGKHGNRRSYMFRLKDNLTSWDCGYPGLESLEGGTLVATTYGTWTADEKPSILSVRFTLAELDALAMENPALSAPIKEPLLPGREIHVAPRPVVHGDDSGEGSALRPFATIERARDEVRAVRKAGALPAGGIAVTLHAGVYELAGTLALSAEDSCAEGAPMVYRAAPGEDVRISGGRRISGWKAVTDPAVLTRLDPAARGHIVQADLKAHGITDFGQMGGGFGLSGGPGLELFFRDQPQTISRYPNEGFITIADVHGPTKIERKNAKACVEGDISYDPGTADRVARWKDEKEPWALGYWLHDWAEQRQRIASIDPATKRMTLAQPYHHYGYRRGGWFYGFNLLCEIDRPGEWYLDRETGIIYFWPPDTDTKPIQDGEATVSILDTLVTLNGAKHVTFQGFTFEAVRGTAIRIDNADGNRVEDCTLRNIGSWAVSISGEQSGVYNCEVTGTGDGGIRLSGGDRRMLTPAHLVAENNHIHHWSRWNRMNRHGIALSGVGNRAANNLLHDSPHTAIHFSGNDHLIELNEIHRVCTESNDAGAIYAGRDWTMRGNVIRHNYLHHLSGFAGGREKGCIGIYLDDMFSGVTITGNVFYDVTNAAYIGGGMDNRIENNLFIDCKPAVHVDARGLGWAHKWPGEWLREIKAKGTLSGVRFDQPPYSERYPELATLLTRTPAPPAPTGNIIARNIQFCGTWDDIEKPAAPLVTLEGNLLGVDPLFIDAAWARTGTSAGRFRLRDDSPAFKVGSMGGVGFERIPVERIGRVTRSAERPK